MSSLSADGTTCTIGKEAGINTPYLWEVAMLMPVRLPP